jgi:hypothetical protein
MKKLFKYVFLLSIIAAAIIIVATIVYPYMLKGIDPQAKVKNGKRSQSVSNEAAIKTYELSNTSSAKRFIYPEGKSRDPFQRISPSVAGKPSQSEVFVATQPEISLTGVVWGNNAPVAIIKDLANNRTYIAKVGQEIGRIKIVEIRRRSIIIKNGDKISELLVWESNPQT